MSFVQIMDFRTSDPDPMFELADEWWEATDGKRTVRREIVGRDRNDPEHYMVVVFFDSYESAVENSDLPETQAGAATMASHAAGEITFHDLDIVQDRS